MLYALNSDTAVKTLNQAVAMAFKEIRAPWRRNFQPGRLHPNRPGPENRQ